MFVPKRSRWKRPNGSILEVCSIWAIGGGFNYTPVSYEVKVDGQLQEILREDFVRMIEKKEIVRL